MSVCPPVRRSFSDECGPGTFRSLGVLPKRTSPRNFPVFHIAHDDDDDDDHSSSFDEHPSSVRFPTVRTSPPPSPGSSSSSPSASRPASPRPQIARGASAPILLSNGKPLKSSLKSSSSSPAMLIPPQAQQMHCRARSEPSTPKNVHFPEKDHALATVRVFKCSARPAALGSPANDETETEGEDNPPTRFPFPSRSPAFNYEIDPTKSSPVPAKYPSPVNLLLESLHLSSSSCPPTNSITKPALTGSILVRNLAFEKHIALRFTLDDWQTVSEVGAYYVDSLSSLPSQILPSTPESTSSLCGRGWDRFTFTIRLEDYAHCLSTRTLWLAARYRVDSTYPMPGSSMYGPGGEWWDNNSGGNYCVVFRPASATPSLPRSRPRRETVSAPTTSPPTQPQLPTTCKKYALGLIVPSIPEKKEDRRLTSPRTGRLTLCNYVPPTVRAASSISFPSVGSPQTSPLSSTNSSFPPSATLRTSSDEETASDTSSTLSTPTVSPTIVPRVIMGGQPATSTYSSGEKDDDNAIIYSKPGYVADWDWSAPGNPQMEALSRQHVDFVPDTQSPERRRNTSPLPERKALYRNNSLYDTFVTQWCFAQGPSPGHHAYDGGGIMT